MEPSRKLAASNLHPVNLVIRPSSTLRPIFLDIEGDHEATWIAVFSKLRRAWEAREYLRERNPG
ncbi:hypothetical protein FA13DRAFT_1739595 [Coprinellus micaceus]|uniref:Uncharacterized protein n=1 Tax=Coprinellus micaceus TaxID=71717 RepID=A0A4Y7SQ04_COPMI|nr:hypothetical protein FA13DRAFT_1739595 [Coprinellus micaceus]